MVTAQPGEHNAIAVEQRPRGDPCRRTAGRRSRARAVPRTRRRALLPRPLRRRRRLARRRRRLVTSGVGGTVDGGPGRRDPDRRRLLDALRRTRRGPPRRDRSQARPSPTRTTPRGDVRLNGVADDGAAGEGDNVLGAGHRHHRRQRATTTPGGEHAERPLRRCRRRHAPGSPEGDTINAGDGNDTVAGGDGNDYLTGGAGADDLGGGGGLDEASYAGATAPLSLSIGDGPNDGAAGENDDIRDDIEALAGGTRERRPDRDRRTEPADRVRRPGRPARRGRPGRAHRVGRRR